MKEMTLSGQRNAFAYPMGMFLIVMNEIDTMMITCYSRIFGNGELASKTFMKKTMSDRIKAISLFVKDKDPNRELLGKVLGEVDSILWIRNALAHGFICGGGDAPSYLTLVAFGHKESFSPEDLIKHVNKAMALSRSANDAIAMITFYDLAMEREGKNN